MGTGSAILALVEGVDLLRETARFRGAGPVGGRGAVALHFISYSHVDGSDFAHRLCEALRRRQRSLRVYIDGDIPLGEQWDLELEQAIDACETFLFIHTHDSANAN